MACQFGMNPLDKRRLERYYFTLCYYRIIILAGLNINWMLLCIKFYRPTSAIVILQSGNFFKVNEHSRNRQIRDIFKEGN